MILYITQIQNIFIDIYHLFIYQNNNFEIKNYFRNNENYFNYLSQNIINIYQLSLKLINNYEKKSNIYINKKK